MACAALAGPRSLGSASRVSQNPRLSGRARAQVRVLCFFSSWLPKQNLVGSAPHRVCEASEGLEFEGPRPPRRPPPLPPLPPPPCPPPRPPPRGARVRHGVAGTLGSFSWLLTGLSVFACCFVCRFGCTVQGIVQLVIQARGSQAPER